MMFGLSLEDCAGVQIEGGLHLHVLGGAGIGKEEAHAEGKATAKSRGMKMHRAF